MDLSKLMQTLKAEGVQVYGTPLWTVETICGRHTLEFDGDNAIIEVAGEKVYAHKSKDAVVAKDGTVEIYTAIAERDYAGEYDGREFDIKKGQVRVFWR